MRIVYHPRALAQLDAILDTVAEHDPRAAQRVAAAIQRSIDTLIVLPYGGRPSEVAGIRELPIVRFPYLVFYEVDAAAAEVTILRIRHTSRDPGNAFE